MKKRKSFRKKSLRKSRKRSVKKSRRRTQNRQNDGTAYNKKYTPVNFEYIIPQTRGISSDLMHTHFKLYESLVAGTNEIITKLQDKSLDSFSYGGLKSRLSFFYDAMKLHELYFEQFNYHNNDIMPLGLQEELVKYFGSVQEWKDDFKKTGQIVDVGFACLVRDKKSGNLLNIFVREFGGGNFIDNDYIMVLDFWEHAYLCQFGLDFKKYEDVFLSNVDWTIVNNRLQKSIEKY